MPRRNYLILLAALLRGAPSAAGDIPIIDLGTLGGPDSFAVDINIQNQVRGCRTIADGLTDGFNREKGTPVTLRFPVLAIALLALCAAPAPG